MKKIIILILLGLPLTSCYMLPMAFIGPASSGFSTASIMQSALTTTTNRVVKSTTGKTISEHVISSLQDKNLKIGFISEKKITRILPKIKGPK